MTTMNPFLLTEYILPKYFHNRKAETERIVGAVTNARNIALFSKRGMGKTALIHSVFNELKELDNIQTIYINVESINNMFDFIKRFVNSLIQSKIVVIINKRKSKRILDGVVVEDYVCSLTKKKTFNLKIKNEKEIIEIFEKIFKHLNAQNKTIVIVFDEFQKIVDSCKEYLVQILIDLIDKSENINFIFSESNKTKMLLLLNDNKKQSINNVEILNIEALEKKKYQKFIIKKFTKGKRKICNESIEYLFEWARLNTYGINKICNVLYKSKYKKIEISSVKEAIFNILKENELYYLGYKNLLSNYQWKLLKAIALEGEAKAITSGAFINKYKLNAPSSVKTAVTALIEKELIINENKTYLIIDIFFERWLANH